LQLVHGEWLVGLAIGRPNLEADAERVGPPRHVVEVAVAGGFRDDSAQQVERLIDGLSVAEGVSVKVAL
jgi:hypothetical protein